MPSETGLRAWECDFRNPRGRFSLFKEKYELKELWKRFDVGQKMCFAEKMSFLLKRQGKLRPGGAVRGAFPQGLFCGAQSAILA